MGVQIWLGNPKDVISTWLVGEQIKGYKFKMALNKSNNLENAAFPNVRLKCEKSPHMKWWRQIVQLSL